MFLKTLFIIKLLAQINIFKLLDKEQILITNSGYVIMEHLTPIFVYNNVNLHLLNGNISSSSHRKVFCLQLTRRKLEYQLEKEGGCNPPTITQYSIQKPIQTRVTSTLIRIFFDLLLLFENNSIFDKREFNRSSLSKVPKLTTSSFFQ